MSDSNSDILSTSDAFTSTHKLAVEVLTAAWTIRPEGEDIDDIADLLGVHLERAVDEEIARRLAEVACVPHDQMRDQLRVAAQQERRRRAFPSSRWAPPQKSTPSGIPAASTWRRICSTPTCSRCCNACPWPSMRTSTPKRTGTGRAAPTATAPRPLCPPPIRRCTCWSWRPNTTGW